MVNQMHTFWHVDTSASIEQNTILHIQNWSMWIGNRCLPCNVGVPLSMIVVCYWTIVNFWEPYNLDGLGCYPSYSSMLRSQLFCLFRILWGTNIQQGWLEKKSNYDWQMTTVGYSKQTNRDDCCGWKTRLELREKWSEIWGVWNGLASTHT